MANMGREGETVEFKESTAEFAEACKAIVGMLNKSGSGAVYFGVKDNGDVVGTKVGKDTMSTLLDRIRASIKPDIYPTILPFEVEGKSVISVTFQGTNKPYAYKGAFFIRVEQQNLPVEPLVLREMIKAGHEYNEAWEKEPTPYGEEAIDHDSVETFYRQAVAMGRINAFDHTDAELLAGLGLMELGRLNNAGYYLFGKNVPLVYKAVEYPTEERLDPIDLKRFEGNLFRLIGSVMGFALEKMRWSVSFDGTKRVETPEIPIVALREIVINSLVHCDFRADSEHQLTVDPKCVEIYSPGPFGDYTPRDYVERAIPSRTKHKAIQGVLYKAFDIETLGRGIKRTDVACKSSGIKWTYEKYPFGFSFLFLRKGPLSQALSKDASVLLEYVRSQGNVLNSIQEAADALSCKQRKAHSTIAELVESGKLVRVGSNKNGHWEVPSN